MAAGLPGRIFRRFAVSFVSPRRRAAPPSKVVILGLAPRIHTAPAAVDARGKPEHDGGEGVARMVGVWMVGVE